MGEAKIAQRCGILEAIFDEMKAPLAYSVDLLLGK
jgi:hypothetical protein